MDEKSEDRRFKTRQERKEEEILLRCERLEVLRGGALDDIIGNVYRVNSGESRTATAQINGFLDDDEFGRTFGPGKYQVAYRYTDLDDYYEEGTEKIKRHSTTVHYSIGIEYTEPHIEECRLTGKKCYLRTDNFIPGQPAAPKSFFESLDTDKIQSFLTILTTLGVLKATPTNDMSMILAETFKTMQVAVGARTGAQNQSNDSNGRITELLLAKALERPQEKSSAQIFKEQMDMFSALQDLKDPAAAARREEEEDTKPKTYLEKMIDKIFPMIPDFLERFNGDEKKAAQAVVRENPAAKLMLKDPEVQKIFYQKMARIQGVEVANRWAQGFGINPEAFKVPAKPVQTAAAKSVPGIIKLG